MASKSSTHVVSSREEAEYVPFSHPKAGGVGTSTYGEMAVLRDGASNGGVLVAGFWRADPAADRPFDMPQGDESAYVIRGSATVELVETGERVELNAGDLYFFAKGTPTRWTVHEPMEKFVVVTD